MIRASAYAGSQMNGTGWFQFDHNQQEQILAAVRKVRRPKIVIPTRMRENWSDYGATYIAPLVRCVTQEYEEEKRIGPYSIFAPKEQLHAKR